LERDVIIINPADNVAVARRDIAAGDAVALPGGGTLRAVADIPRGHKVAMADIARGEPVLKYGECIGVATEDIGAGGWVHTHNIEPAGTA
jgi:altronate dehydratase